MNDPALSIIIPCYNAQQYLAQAICSAQRQTLRDIEIIVVDDGSRDNSWRIVERYMSDPRIRLLRLTNQGIAGARNAGLALARGEFVAFLDADDRWFIDKAACHVQHLRSDPTIDVSFSWYAVIDAFGNDTGRRGRARAGTFSWIELLRENFVWNGQPVMRRATLRRVGEFDGTLPSHEDYEYILRIGASRERCVACLPQVLAEYRRRPGQLTSDWQAMHDGWVITMQRMRQMNPVAFVAVEHEARARHYRYLAYLAWEAGQNATSRVFLLRAWRAQPLRLAQDRRAWLTTAAVCLAALPPTVGQPLIHSAEQRRAHRHRLLRA
jgi:glycosyltransferase involved in cell wall biosynthesis